MASAQVALITAGSAGLGAAIARVLATEAKMRVVINYSANAERANALLKELNNGLSESSGEAQCKAIKADVSQPNEIKRLVQETVSAMGRLDVVVSNAGWYV